MLAHSCDLRSAVRYQAVAWVLISLACIPPRCPHAWPGTSLHGECGTRTFRSSTSRSTMDSSTSPTGCWFCAPSTQATWRTRPCLGQALCHRSPAQRRKVLLSRQGRWHGTCTRISWQHCVRTVCAAARASAQDGVCIRRHAHLGACPATAMGDTDAAMVGCRRVDFIANSVVHHVLAPISRHSYTYTHITGVPIAPPHPNGFIPRQ